jgi:hypothetical protein
VWSEEDGGVMSGRGEEWVWWGEEGSGCGVEWRGGGVMSGRGEEWVWWGEEGSGFGVEWSGEDGGGMLKVRPVLNSFKNNERRLKLKINYLSSWKLLNSLH